jgi:hypothetical protein
MTQKTQNTMKPIAERVNTLYRYGMVVTAGFIMGFDGEKRGMDLSMIKLIEDCSVNMAMIGMLVALPNTQLTRRLLKEGRLLSFQGRLVSSEKEMIESAHAEGSVLEVVDQTLAGLNFVTTRDRMETLDEYQNVVRTVYEPKRYFDRVLRVGLALKMRSKHRPGLFELRRSLRGLVRLSIEMSKDPVTRPLYWRNVARLMWRGRHVFEQAMRLMGIYLHFKNQTAYLFKAMAAQRPAQARLPRDICALPRQDLRVASGEPVAPHPVRHEARDSVLG